LHVAPICRPRGGHRRPPCACSTTTSTPRSPNTPRNSSSTEARARQPVTGAVSNASPPLCVTWNVTRRSWCNPESRWASCPPTNGLRAGSSPAETFAAVAARRCSGTLAGTITLTAGLGGMGGAQPLAVTMNDGVAIVVECDRSRIDRRLEHRYLDACADDLEHALALAVRARDER